jgi:subtilisin family serine protease
MQRPIQALTTLISVVFPLCAAQPLRAQGTPAAGSAAPALFAEIPGVQEFRGVLCARPLQAEDAAARGLNEAAREQLVRGARALLSSYRIPRYSPEVDEYLVEVPAGETEESVARRLLATGGFAYVEPDWVVFPVECPNDARFITQWHHEANRLRSCDAWGIEKGKPSVVIAICDTGVRKTHVDLAVNRREGFHVPSQTWESAGGPIDDINGHGTLCTGAAAGYGNNSFGIVGMGWNLSHRMMRVTDSPNGNANLSDLTLAARTAADVGDRVASVSYSGVNSSTVFTAGTYVRGKNAMLVWAAGNDNTSLSGNRNDSVIIVGATNNSDGRAGFSNYGSLVDFMAPGTNISTSSMAGDDSYAAVDGTSFACPITAGLVGLIWSRNPTLTPTQVENIIRNSCLDLGSNGVDNTYGYGRIRSYEALLATSAGPTGITSFCAGDGLTLACPCGNDGAFGRGCANSSNGFGALLYGTGNLNPDQLVLQAHNVTATASCVFLQGTTSVAHTTFGDGLRCVGGTLKRLAVKNAANGIVTYPVTGETAIRARSQALGDTIPAGGIRRYQVYYRDPNGTYCPGPVGNTYNITNGVQVSWP